MKLLLSLLLLTTLLFSANESLAKPEQYGECQFSVDFKQRRAKVRVDIRGTIARDYLYFNHKYKMKLSKQELKKYQAWNKEYPADEWEIERNKRIAKKQGNVNPFISKH